MQSNTGNLVLDSLPTHERDDLLKDASSVRLERGACIYSHGEPFDRLYFPTSGMISQVVTLLEGHSAETAVIGRAEAFALEPWLGGKVALADSSMQVAGDVIVMPSDVLENCPQRFPSLDAALRRQARIVMATMGITLACNAVHEVKSRLARWLLAVQDRVEDEDLLITHDFLAMMLATGRPSVTLSAIELRESGAIAYGRGRIRVLDRERLKENSCECGLVAHDLYEELLPVRS